ncbi:unnamed protein product [Brachionus calyciflorus]|uniref:Reverse transcriptase domain-containing protein n=1 Tax=Brachionus calyciflorus TaxID=104777 RepID=A0A814FAI6_9BILA|nr:unnamed protein product [Brachionus calyciflorus]
MKGGGEIERTRFPDQALGPKTKNNRLKSLKIATYNVRSLRGSGKEYQLTTGCNKQKINIITIQEHRHKFDEEIKFTWNNDETWLKAFASAREDGNGGIGFLIDKKTANSLRQVDKVTERIIIAHFDGNPQLTIVACYAPTNLASKNAKETFYQDLKNTLAKIPPHNIVIVLGDFNARIGKDEHKFNPILVGQHSFHEQSNENGQYLVELCEGYNLRPVSTRFPHRSGRLWTWEHPTGAKAQLDHVLIRGKWVNSIRNCRAYNSINIDSDHRIVCADFRLSLRSQKQEKNKRTKYNWELLVNGTKTLDFDIELKNKYNVLTEKQEQKMVDYDLLLEAIEDISKQVLGKKKKTKLPSWVTTKTEELQEQCDIARKKYRSKKTASARHLWRTMEESLRESFRNDEKKYLDNQLREMEIAANRNQLGRTWELINKLSGKSERKVTKVKKLNGKTPKSNDELLKDWAFYFEKLLNAEDNNEENIPPPADKDLEIRSDYFTRAEIDEAIDSLKNGKSPCIDSCMVSEVLKYGGDFIRTLIHEVCVNVYNNYKAPKQWTKNLIFPIPKKGNPQLMTNYRGITLMSIAAKVHNKVLLNRIIPIVDQVLRRNQAGFRKGRSCIQQIHILRRIMEGASARQLPLFITFIDFKKAFDSISRKMMFGILRHYGIPEKIVRAIEVLYKDSRSQVYVDGVCSEDFKISSGVLQGDVLAPSLFIIVLDYVMRKSERDFGFITHPRKSQRHQQRLLNDLDYAVDIALLERSLEEAQKQLNETCRNAKEVGLEINVTKTKVMVINANKDKKLKINNEDIEVVDEFKYLGSNMSSSEKDMKCRKGQAWSAFRSLEKIWTSKTTSIELKIRIFQASCLSILLYGSETWILDQKLLDELDSYATNCYRNMLGIKRLDKVPNSEIYKKVKQVPISLKLAKRTLTWIGHMLRRPTDEPIKIYGLYEPSQQMGRSKLGRQTTSYAKYVAKLINKSTTLTVEEIERAAQNRTEWRKLVIACTTVGD